MQGLLQCDLGQGPQCSGVLADFVWRQPGSIYYHPNICEVPGAISTLALEAFEQPLTIQATLPLPKASKRSSQASDQGQGAKGAKDKGKGKEKKPSSKAKNVAKDKEAAAKAKEVESKTKEVDPKGKDASTSQPSQKKDPLAPKAKAQHLGFFVVFFFFFWQWHSVTEYNVLFLFNENAFLLISCTFTLYVLKLITIANGFKLLLLCLH